MSFYGHAVETFVPDFSWIETVGRDLSKIPEAVAYEQKMREGQIENKDIYSAVSAMIEGIDEKELKNVSGYDKNTILSIAKYGKEEDPATYTARVVNLLDKAGMKDIAARKGIRETVAEIEARMQGGTYYPEELKAGAIGEEGMDPEFAKTLEKPSEMGQQTGLTGYGEGVQPPEQKQVTPSDVMAIGQKRGVSPDQLAPQMAQAEQGISEKQLTGIGGTPTRFEGYQSAIQKGPIGKTTEKALGALPTQKDIMVDQAKREALEARERMHAENMRLRNRVANIEQQEITADERRKIITDKAKNEARVAALNVRIASIKSGMSKMKNEFGELDEERIDQSTLELNDLVEEFEVLNENSELYDRLLKEKDEPYGGGVTKPDEKKPKKKSRFKIVSVE